MKNKFLEKYPKLQDLKKGQKVIFNREIDSTFYKGKIGIIEKIALLQDLKYWVGTYKGNTNFGIITHSRILVFKKDFDIYDEH